jgi:hypothetical protein
MCSIRYGGILKSDEYDSIHEQLTDRLNYLINTANEMKKAGETRDLSEQELDDLQDVLISIEECEDYIILEEQKINGCSCLTGGCNCCLGLSY